MRLPWQGRTGLAKDVAFLASVLTISVGLCGANAFLYGQFINYEKTSALGTLLLITGILEAGAIVLSALGLIAVTLDALARWIYREFLRKLK